VGASIIVGSTLYITRREAKLGKEKVPTPPLAPSEPAPPP